MAPWRSLLEIDRWGSGNQVAPGAVLQKPSPVETGRVASFIASAVVARIVRPALGSVKRACRTCPASETRVELGRLPSRWHLCRTFVGAHARAVTASSTEVRVQGDAPLVATKLVVPLAPGRYQARDRLADQLDAALDDRIRLALVAAPPGYGKTVAVAGWLAARRVPCAWLSLEPADGDMGRFLRYLTAAIAPLRPSAEQACAGLLGPGTSPSPQLAAATLLDAISSSDDPIVLVLDDYHAVAEASIHGLVGYVVEHAPPFCHLVLVTREDPPLPLARLRAHGQLVEVRAADLRFTADETAAYLAGVPGLSPEGAELLFERTEGWPAALQLASLGMARAGGPESIVAAFATIPRHVFDYLADEVLAELEPDLVDFLVRTSIVDRFCAPLCAALAERDDAGDVLAQAERANLFVVPLDEERRWFRFHGLFADYLGSQLDDAERRALHLRAARWLEGAGTGREAIPHLLAAGDADAAAHAIVREARAAFEAGEDGTLLRWIDALPPGCVAAYPDLVAWHAWALFDTGQLADADAEAARHLAAAGERGAAEGRLLALRALLQTVTGPEAAELARAGLELVGDDPYFRATCEQAIGLAALARGELGEAVASLEAAFEAIRHLGPAIAFPGVTPLAQALLATGRRDAAERLCLELVAEYEPSSIPGAGSWYLDVVLGMLRYEANDVAEARRLLERGFASASRFRVGRTTIEWGVTHLAFARRATGDFEAALDALRMAAADVRRGGIPLPLPLLETEARLRLLEGDVRGPASWVETAEAEAADASPLAPHLALSRDVTVARVRLAQRRAAEARRLLRGPEAAYRAMGAIADLIPAVVLRAVADELDARRPDAIRSLSEAVTLAAPGGYVRRIVDDAGPVAHLLPLVRGAAPAFVDEVLAARRPSGAGGSVWDAGDRIIELLTPRELEVLRQLAQGARNVEIADALGVSPGTARWHVANLLAKLGERSRAKAVSRARALGIV